jgi:hypothetical protein
MESGKNIISKLSVYNAKKNNLSNYYTFYKITKGTRHACKLKYIYIYKDSINSSFDISNKVHSSKFLEEGGRALGEYL